MSDSYQFSNVFVTNQSTSLEAAQRELASLLANGPLSASNFTVRPRHQVGVSRSWGAQKSGCPEAGVPRSQVQHLTFVHP